VFCLARYGTHFSNVDQHGRIVGRMALVLSLRAERDEMTKQGREIESRTEVLQKLGIVG